MQMRARVVHARPGLLNFCCPFPRTLNFRPQRHFTFLYPPFPFSWCAALLLQLLLILRGRDASRGAAEANSDFIQLHAFFCVYLIEKKSANSIFNVSGKS